MAFESILKGAAGHHFLRSPRSNLRLHVVLVYDARVANAYYELLKTNVVTSTMLLQYD